jgi:predicted acylesterase/phospholipase RssA
MVNARLRTAIRASCSVGGAMDYQELGFSGQVYKVSDGGHLHTIPPAPRRHKGEPVTAIDVIMCNPASLSADVGGKEREEPDTMFSSFVWVLEAALAQTQIHDLENLKQIAKSGVKVQIYAPAYQVGGLVEASRAVIQEQLALGERMLETPISAMDLH